MTYIIVYKNGNIKRFINVNYCDVGNFYITLYCNNNKYDYAILKKDIASVVFYP